MSNVVSKLNKDPLLCQPCCETDEERFDALGFTLTCEEEPFDQVLALTEELGMKEDKIIALEKRIEAEQKSKIALVKKLLKLLPLQVYSDLAPSPHRLGRPEDIYDYFLDNIDDVVNHTLELFDENGSEIMAMSVEERQGLFLECVNACHLNFNILSEEEVYDNIIDEELCDIEELKSLPIDERNEQIMGYMDEHTDCSWHYNLREMLGECSINGQLRWSKETQNSVIDRNFGEGEWWLCWEY